MPLMPRLPQTLTWGCLAFLIALHLSIPAVVEADDETIQMVDTFDQGIQNELGGYHNTYQREPSSAKFMQVEDVYRGESGKSLRIDIDRQDAGFCGLWMHFFNFRDKPHAYFDTSPYRYLSFWVKGAKGGEPFDVKLADAKWIAKEDSLRINSIDQYLPDGVTTQWQEVLIPLQQIPRLDRRQLGGLTLDFTTPGQYTVYIDDVSFKTDPDIPTPLTRKMQDAGAGHKPYPKAMWIWASDVLLEDAAARRRLFAFCKQQDVNMIWAQLLYAFDPEVDFNSPPDLEEGVPVTRCVIKHPDKVRQLLSEAHEAGIEVHALDGYPEYAQKAFHHAPLAVVDAVIAFNKESQPAQRFDGIHFDNEPYLLVGWQDQAKRESVLHDFLVLNAECQRRVRELSDMEFGVDIPFWWQSQDTETGQYFGQVRFNERDDAASYFCIDLLDNVGIMNYRDRAGGADGMIAHGRDILEYSDKNGGAAIYMGVETFTYDPTEVWFATGLPHQAFAEAVRGRAKDFAMLSRIHGYRFQTFDDGLNIHVGIELPPAMTREEKDRVRQIMGEVARRFGASDHPEHSSDADRLAKDAQFALVADVEWEGFRLQNIVDPSTESIYSGFVATSIMLSKTTFANKSITEMRSQVQAAEDFFRQYKCYRGIAVHYYETYRKLIDAESH